MIVREDRTYEVNYRYPDINWYGDEPGVYVVDETTPEGMALAEKIMMLFPYFDLVVEDGVLVDIVENPTLKDEYDQQIEDETNDITPIVTTKESLGLDKVDNTSDLDKPISNATQSALDLKVDKVAGKGLSTEDYTTAEKSKLAGIADGANKYVHPDKHPPTIIVQDANNRFMTDAERTKLAGLTNYNHPETHPASMITGLATVATTGSYNDLLNKPTETANKITVGASEPIVEDMEEGEIYFQYTL